ncbi:hypothetical protein BY996DRAFT_6411469 [Phakopsora pachyrhizi]|uniref:Uncharacterized protein n=1 Tax=Phakopsora pachyrhizi TaxID=170000 RepID=A0AAV0BT81_PHAPC|nr:hypothetical protein BY996DRAFT_6411469 [Phakopsora pachyrhizi]CAH7690620.1 hypothetical protein PPACK8108_LOCUS26025 [Phakopsora pachyrhizi]
MRMDKLISMMGWYGPCNNRYVKRFVSKESPSGMLVRFDTYLARSRVIDKDNHSRPKRGTTAVDDSSNKTSQISQPLTTTEASQVRLAKEIQDGRNTGKGVDEDNVKSKPEDSESKWHCEIAVQGKSMKTRSSVARGSHIHITQAGSTAEYPMELETNQID